MNEQKAVPNIRFKGFDDKWKDTVIGKLVKVYDGVHQTPKYKNNGVPFVSVENISNLYTNKFISKSDFEKNFKNSKPTSGDLLMTRIGDIGTVNLVKNDNDLAYYVSLALLKPKTKDRRKYINSYFLMYLIESPRIKKELWKRTLHIAFPKKINKNEISKVNLCICLNWKEQQKIGEFFTKLDTLLDLRQKKINKLELLKKALLQKLFPKHDAKIPELRFKGFYNKWERTTISEMGKVTTGNTPSTKQKRYYSKMGIPWITPSNIDKNGNLYNVKYLSKDGAKIGRIVPKGSVLVTSIASIGKNTLLKEDSAFNQQINAITPKKKYNSSFLYTACNQLSKEMKVIASAGTMQIVNKKEFSKMLINCPLLPEQQKIGNLLSKVDQLIELENKKLHNLQQVKKCLLQNMFVE